MLDLTTHVLTLTPHLLPHLATIVQGAQPSGGTGGAGVDSNIFNQLFGIGDDATTAAESHIVKIAVLVAIVGGAMWMFGQVKGRTILFTAAGAFVALYWLIYSFIPSMETKFTPPASAGLRVGVHLIAHGFGVR